MTNEIKQYFDILEQLVADEHTEDQAYDKRQYRQSIIYKLSHYLQLVSVTCCVLAIIGWVLTTTIPSCSWLMPVASLAFIVFFLLLSVQVLIVFVSKSSGLAVMRIHGYSDSKYLSALMALSQQTLALGCLELEHGRNWFSRGYAMLIGVLEKVGIIPSLLSLIAILVLPDKLPSWATPLVAVCLLLYAISLVTHERLLRFDRLLALTQLAITLKNNQQP